MFRSIDDVAAVHAVSIWFIILPRLKMFKRIMERKMKNKTDKI